MSTANKNISQTEPQSKESSKTPKTGFKASSWLLALAIVYTLYFGSSLLVPILVALLMALLLSPVVELLKKLYVPRSISALLLLVAIGTPLGFVTAELAQPAQKWASRLPELNAFMNEKLSELAAKTKAIEPTAVQPQKEEKGFWSSLFGSDEPEEPIIQKPPTNGGEIVSDKIVESGMDAAVSLMLATPVALAQLMTTLLLFLFLLIFGPKLFETFSKVIAIKNDSRKTILLVANLRRHLSRYIITVSLINLSLGITTAALLWWLGVEDALLWGALAAVLNFAPYVGPLVLTGILAIAGLAQYGPSLAALLPASIYLVVNIIEAQLITPLVLGHNIRLNPLVILIWLIILGWLWGASGVLLAVPLLVCIKIVVQSLEIAPHWIRVLESKA